MTNRNTWRGFTLMEVLIAVLIIGILAAIAVPQYQKAVLKSRFSSLMPTTQAIRDGQEMYYMTNGRYADDKAKLDVKATNTEDMEIEVSDEEGTPELSYVIASRPNINNNLIMYQKHSPKFADTVHCEALKDNAQAQWLCKDALHGQPIDGSIHAEYDTYLLSGTLGENDYFAKECEGSGEQACECGSIQGTCNDKTGNWEYSGECLDRPATSQTCAGGRQLRSVTCGENGWQTGTWSNCASEAAITAYEEIQKYDELFKQIRDAQEAYYTTHNNKYATALNDLGITWPSQCSIITGGGGNYGHWLKCGNDLFIDNGSDQNGFLMVEYCPGHNTGYYDCRDRRTNIAYYWYDHPRESAISASDRDIISPGNEGCLVMNGSSVGTEVCNTFY